MTINKRLAKSVSYGSKRDKNDVRYIVFHYTSNKGDTAAGNANYFATSNTRQAGAHFFVDKAGVVYKSVNMDLVAWSVGGFFTQSGGAGSYYKKCTNGNSVSVELCDLVSGEPSSEQLKACRELVKYIRKYCPNAKTIIRHWDVNGKCCPATMIGKDNKSWNRFKEYVEGGSQNTTPASSTATKTKKDIPAVASASPNLKKGSTGTQVKYLQQDLNYVMKSGLNVDGDFGSKTQSVLKAFQKKYGLTADGVYGTKSRAKMEKLLV